MGMTAVEKILARASGQSVVQPGDIIFSDPDIVIVHDGLVASAKQELDELGIDEVFDPERIHFVTDHDVIYTNPRAAERGYKNRLAAKAWGIKHFSTPAGAAKDISFHCKAALCGRVCFFSTMTGIAPMSVASVPLLFEPVTKFPLYSLPARSGPKCRNPYA